MKFRTELITPIKAMELLKTNESNRKLKRNAVDKYALDMSAGRWREDTGETIKISKRGKLLDGQHRLAAIVKSGINIVMPIAYDLPDDIFEVIDTGKTRTPSDIFYIAGVQYAALLPSIMTKYILLKEARHIHNVRSKPSPMELIKYFESDEERWINTAKMTAKFYENMAKVVPGSIIGCTYSLFYDVDRVDAARFWDQLSTGNTSFHPVVLLRKKLIADRISQYKMPTSNKIAIIIKVWNYYRTNQQVKLLSYRPEVEDFPTAN